MPRSRATLKSLVKSLVKSTEKDGITFRVRGCDQGKVKGTSDGTVKDRDKGKINTGKSKVKGSHCRWLVGNFN
jgi:hypothetical protein